ncbi:MAG: hypothetical protein AAFS10_27290 [Myxococcota bacterium]
MKMDITIGSMPDLDNLSARLGLELYPERFAVPWEQCGATANFVADWFLDTPDALVHLADATQRSQWHGSVSYVLNELLENAFKFHTGSDSILLLVGLSETDLVVLVRNTALSETAAALPAIVEPLVHGDPSELLFARIEANAEEEDEDTSGLGFLTMRTDYDVTLGWRLQTSPSCDDRVQVSTAAWLPIA